MIRIAATQYTLKNKAFEIYVAGCKADPHCENCHNPELWSFKNGKTYNKDYQDKIHMKIIMFDNLIDNIWIVGGEPLDQPKKDLDNLLSDLSKMGKDMWLFTRYDLKKIPKEILKYFKYVKCGRYVPSKATDKQIEYNVRLASSNQHIYKKGKDF